MRVSHSSFGMAVAASAVMALFMVTGCGGGGTSDDPGLTHDSVMADSVDLTDVAGDVVVPDDGRPLDINTPDSVEDTGTDIVDDPGTDTGDVSCGTCTGGKICVEGECQCPATQKDCDGTCTTLGTNENCSGCGDECPTGGSCESGNCECPGAQVNCSGTCTILGTDENCSECYDACVGVKSCQDGECVAEVDPDCVSDILCVTDDDCESGSRCNQAMDFPACQKLYCGGYGTACSEDYFCLSKICWDDACTNDCDDLECGPDPVYGESCGTCQEGATCRSNVCECDLQDHLECVAGNSTWIDSCGNVGEVKEGCTLACLNGACVDCEAVGKVNCSGVCRLLGTTSNCSECGDVCPVGGSCNEGTCECPVGEADCSGTCALLGTNSNCSVCGDACTGGKECSGGICECLVGQAVCDGICTPLGSDWNCSGCGDSCPEGGFCNSGICECPEGETNHSGTCVITIYNIQTSNESTACTTTSFIKTIQEDITLNDLVVISPKYVASSGRLDGYYVCQGLLDPLLPYSCMAMTIDVAATEKFVPGDVIDMAGKYIEYYCFSEFSVLSATKVGTSTIPIPITIAPEDLGTQAPETAEPLEGVLVRIENVEIIESPEYASDGEDRGAFRVTGDAIIGNQFRLAYMNNETDGRATGQKFLSITGVVAYSFGRYEIMPRTIDDLEFDGDPLVVEKDQADTIEPDGEVSGTSYTMYDLQTRTESTACTTDGFVNVLNGVSFAPVIVVTPKFSASAALDGYYVMDYGIGGSLLSHGMAVVVEKTLATAFVPGDVISITDGNYYEYYCMSQIKITAVEKTATDTTPPPTDIALATLENGGLDDIAAAEELEGLLVTIPATTITAATSTDTKTWFEVGNKIHIDKQFNIADFTPITNTTLSSITGVVRWNYGKYRLTPRTGADIVISQ